MGYTWWYEIYVFRCTMLPLLGIKCHTNSITAITWKSDIRLFIRFSHSNALSEKVLATIAAKTNIENIKDVNNVWQVAMITILNFFYHQDILEMFWWVRHPGCKLPAWAHIQFALQHIYRYKSKLLPLIAGPERKMQHNNWDIFRSCLLSSAFWNNQHVGNEIVAGI